MACFKPKQTVRRDYPGNAYCGLAIIDALARERSSFGS